MSIPYINLQLTSTYITPKQRYINMMSKKSKMPYPIPVILQPTLKVPEGTDIILITFDADTMSVKSQKAMYFNIFELRRHEYLNIEDTYEYTYCTPVSYNSKRISSITFRVKDCENIV